MQRTIMMIAAGALASALASCATVEVKPIKVEVQPIHVTVDVRIQRDLDDFFDFDKDSKKPATQPAANDEAEKQTT